jgi:hypothetical protein
VIVELSDHLTNPVKVPATRVLITGNDGTPILFVVTFQEADGREHVRTFRAGDDEFEEQLRIHGFKHTVVVTKLDPKKMIGAAAFNIR